MMLCDVLCCAACSPFPCLHPGLIVIGNSRTLCKNDVWASWHRFITRRQLEITPQALKKYAQKRVKNATTATTAAKSATHTSSAAATTTVPRASRRTPMDCLATAMAAHMQQLLRILTTAMHMLLPRILSLLLSLACLVCLSLSLRVASVPSPVPVALPACSHRELGMHMMRHVHTILALVSIIPHACLFQPHHVATTTSVHMHACVDVELAAEMEEMCGMPCICNCIMLLMPHTCDGHAHVLRAWMV